MMHEEEDLLASKNDYKRTGGRKNETRSIHRTNGRIKRQAKSD